MKERLIERSLGGAQTNKIRVLRPLQLQRFVELAEIDTMEELDKELRKPCTVPSVDVTITLLTRAMQSSM